MKTLPLRRGGVMGENGDRWVELKNRLKFFVAKVAINFCGVEVIYWSAPREWEEYMSVGEPLTPEIYNQDEAIS